MQILLRILRVMLLFNDFQRGNLWGIAQHNLSVVGDFYGVTNRDVRFLNRIAFGVQINCVTACDKPVVTFGIFRFDNIDREGLG